MERPCSRYAHPFHGVETSAPRTSHHARSTLSLVGPASSTSDGGTPALRQVPSRAHEPLCAGPRCPRTPWLAGMHTGAGARSASARGSRFVCGGRRSLALGLREEASRRRRAGPTTGPTGAAIHRRMNLSVVRWDPFRELESVSDRLNRVFGRDLTTTGGRLRPPFWAPAVGHQLPPPLRCPGCPAAKCTGSTTRDTRRMPPGRLSRSTGLPRANGTLMDKPLLPDSATSASTNSSSPVRSAELSPHSALSTSSEPDADEAEWAIKARPNDKRASVASQSKRGARTITIKATCCVQVASARMRRAALDANAGPPSV